MLESLLVKLAAIRKRHAQRVAKHSTKECHSTLEHYLEKSFRDDSEHSNSKGARMLSDTTALHHFEEMSAALAPPIQ